MWSDWSVPMPVRRWPSVSDWPGEARCSRLKHKPRHSAGRAGPGGRDPQRQAGTQGVWQAGQRGLLAGGPCVETASRPLLLSPLGRRAPGRTRTGTSTPRRGAAGRFPHAPSGRRARDAAARLRRSSFSASLAAVTRFFSRNIPVRTMTAEVSM